MKTLLRVLVLGFALVGAVALATALGFARTGVSAREAPPATEAWAARTARHFLIPAAARARANPVEPSEAVLDRAREHWVDHCVTCHARDGSGDTAIGRNSYPRVPDITRPGTQRLSDGELFWIIENGVKLTGMPAWGKETAEDDDHAWGLVHWIRRLPQLTPGETEAMTKPSPPAAGHEHDEHAH
jgi:mono/diheme cytochrome c family protein